MFKKRTVTLIACHTNPSNQFVLFMLAILVNFAPTSSLTNFEANLVIQITPAHFTLHNTEKATVKPKQAGACGRAIRNEHTSKSLICTNII